MIFEELEAKLIMKISIYICIYHQTQKWSKINTAEKELTINRIGNRVKSKLFRI